MKVLSGLRGFADGLATGLEARSGWVVAGVSTLYFAVTGPIAWCKPLWNDELYTLYIARLPTLGDVWAALSTGAEQTPPFFYVVTRASLALLGQSELALRLPAVVGFWAMALCLYRFVSNHGSALAGLAAMLFPLVTSAYYYATEARPYGLVLGFSGAALLCWQGAADAHRSCLRLAGLSLSVAAAVSLHYQAVFVLLPIALAEAVHTLVRRRVAMRVWVALALGAAVPLLAFVPLIVRATRYSAAFWATPRWGQLPEFYYALLAPSPVTLLTLLVLTAVYPLPPRPRNPEALAAPPRAEDLAAALGFLTIPIIAVTLSMLVTGAFTDRYALPAVLGASLLVAFAARWSAADRPAIVALLILVLCGSFVLRGLESRGRLAATREAQARTIVFLRSETLRNLPIAVSDQHAFTSLAHYAPRDIAGRLVYLADPAMALAYLGHNSVERGAVDLVGPWFGLPVEDYRSYLASRARFLVYGNPGHFLNWLVVDLSTSGRTIELRGRDDAALLFLVGPAGSPGDGAPPPGAEKPPA